MIGNTSGGQGSEDLAIMILRVAADPKKTEARLQELRAAEASVEEQRHDLLVLRDKMDADFRRLAEQERAVTLRERSVAATEQRQEERSQALATRANAHAERTAELNAQALAIREAVDAMNRATAKNAKDKADLDALRAELNALKRSYEVKLAALKEIVK